MDQLLKNFPLQDLLLGAFLLGVWWSDRRSEKRAASDAASRRAQGERLGDLEKAYERLAAHAASRSYAE